MSALKNLHNELCYELAEIESVLRRFNYAATPTLVLRHKDGSSKSIVLGNDDLSKVIQTIADLNGPEVKA